MSGTSLTDTSGERGMIKTMGMVIASLILLSLFIVSMARLLGTEPDDAADPLMRNALVSRIEPLGAVRTSAEDLEQVASADMAMASAERTGEELVQGVCAGCHAAGAAGAPLLGDEAAWAERRELGLDTLVASVINGKGSMPARGGSDYTDEEIRRSVLHIAMFPEAETEGEAAASDAAAETDEAETAAADAAESESGEMASVEASATTMTEDAKDGEPITLEELPSGGQVDPAEPAVEGTAMAATPEGTTDEAAVTTRDVATDEGMPGELATEAVADDVGTSAPTVEMGAEALTALIATGQEPEGLTDEIKAQVNGVCAGCHISGVANAPMLGDKEAWAARAELGLAALTESVINGKGVMPARGGSTLTDEQIPIAIQYQMGKTGP